MTFMKKYVRIITIIGVLLISIIGMAEVKQLIETEDLFKYEVYFWTFGVIFCGTLSGVVIKQGFDMWASYRQLKNEHAKAELALLKSKVDPHFFFNTLNNLYGLTVEKSEKAPEVILELSEIMRYVIYDGNKDRVSLKKEIEYLEKYIRIHEIRFHKKVDIRFVKNIESNKIEIAPLLLVILIENAFKHGVESLEEDAFLHIDLNEAGNQLSFSVINNFKENERAKSGIGLNNLKKRLQLIYKNNYELKLEKNVKKHVFKAQIKLRL
jgi:LytS/YehU family sensor histidine kinase